MKKKYLLIILFSITLYGQFSFPSTFYQTDTSFSLYSAAAKVNKAYPEAKAAYEELNDSVRIKENIVYCEIGASRLMLDAYIPSYPDTTLFPAVILIHGGGWHSGNRLMEKPIAIYLAKRGIASFTVDYRMAPEFPYPAAVIDLKTALRWIKSTSSEYSVDTNHIAALGCSAGAELATFIGTTCALADFSNDLYVNHTNTIQAIVNIDGIVDFTHNNSTKYDLNPKKPCAANIWLGGSFKDKGEKWKEASPIQYVDKNTPPIVFINSCLEDYHAGRDEFIAKLKNYDIYYEVHTIENTPHPFWLFHPWYDKTCNYIYSFLYKVFNLKNN